MDLKFKMKVRFEKGTTWITVDGATWKRNKLPPECVDTFGDVWLKPYFNASNVYRTVIGEPLCFSIEDGHLEVN